MFSVYDLPLKHPILIQPSDWTCFVLNTPRRCTKSVATSVLVYEYFWYDYTSVLDFFSSAYRKLLRDDIKKVSKILEFISFFWGGVESVSQPTAHRIIIRETRNKFKRENFMFVSFDALAVLLTKHQFFQHVTLWRLAKCHWRFERS